MITEHKVPYFIILLSNVTCAISPKVYWGENGALFSSSGWVNGHRTGVWLCDLVIVSNVENFLKKHLYKVPQWMCGYNISSYILSVYLCIVLLHDDMFCLKIAKIFLIWMRWSYSIKGEGIPPTQKKVFCLMLR